MRRLFIKVFYQLEQKNYRLELIDATNLHRRQRDLLKSRTEKMCRENGNQFKFLSTLQFDEKTRDGSERGLMLPTRNISYHCMRGKLFVGFHFLLV